MARQKNDGRGRLGGRQKGTPNKLTSDLRDWIARLLQDGQEQYVKDLKAVEPMERLKIYTSLLRYVVPQAQEMLDETDKEECRGVRIVVENQQQADELQKMLDRL